MYADIAAVVIAVVIVTKQQVGYQQDPSSKKRIPHKMNKYSSNVGPDMLYVDKSIIL